MASIFPDAQGAKSAHNHSAIHCSPLNGQDNLDSHVLSLMHNFAINEHLISSDPVADLICGICSSRDLDLTPLLVGRNELSLGCEILKLLVDTLLLDATLSLDKWRF